MSNAMSFADSDEQDQLLPSKNPIKVYLAKLPEYSVSDKGDASVEFTYRAKDGGATRSFRVFDVWKVKEDAKPKLVAANKAKLLAIYTVLMTPEKQKSFKDIMHENLKAFHELAISYFDSNVLDLELEIIFGYDKKRGYAQFPTFGSFISSAYRPRNLEFDPNLLSLKPVERKDGNKPDEDDDDEGI